MNGLEALKLEPDTPELTRRIELKSTRLTLITTYRECGSTVWQPLNFNNTEEYRRFVAEAPDSPLWQASNAR